MASVIARLKVGSSAKPSVSNETSSYRCFLFLFWIASASLFSAEHPSDHFHPESTDLVLHCPVSVSASRLDDFVFCIHQETQARPYTDQLRKVRPVVLDIAAAIVFDIWFCLSLIRYVTISYWLHLHCFSMIVVLECFGSRGPCLRISRHRMILPPMGMHYCISHLKKLSQTSKEYWKGWTGKLRRLQRQQ